MKIAVASPVSVPKHLKHDKISYVYQLSSYTVLERQDSSV